MYLGDPEQTLQADINDCKHNADPIKKNCPVPVKNQNRAVTNQTLGASVRQQWLPDTPKNPNFSINIYAGRNNLKNGERWSLIF